MFASDPDTSISSLYQFYKHTDSNISINQKPEKHNLRKFSLDNTYKLYISCQRSKWTEFIVLSTL